MNQIYARLKKENFGRNILIGGGMLILGIFMFIVMNMDLFSYLSASVNVFDLAVEGIQEDVYYTADINYLLDCYAENDEGCCYITSSYNTDGDGVFMGVFIYNSSVEKADEIVDRTWEVLENSDADEYIQDVYLSGRGTVRVMGYEEQEFFDEYLKEALEVDDVSEYVCHKTYVLTPVSKVLSVNTIILELLPLILIIFGLILVIGYLTGYYKKSVKKTMVNNNIKEAELVMDLASGIHLKNVDIGKKYMLIYNKGGKLLPYKTLVWAYVTELKTRHMLYGIIPTGTTTSISVQFYDINGKNYEYPVKKKFDGEEILRYLSDAAPYLLIGYSEQLQQAASQNYGQLVQSVKEQRMKFEANTMPDAFQSGTESTVENSFDPYFG